MYGLPLTTYADLDKTGKELNLLQTLYDLYQKYIEFDETFRDTLWQDVNLDTSLDNVSFDFWGLHPNSLLPPAEFGGSGVWKVAREGCYYGNSHAAGESRKFYPFVLGRAHFLHMRLSNHDIPDLFLATLTSSFSDERPSPGL